MGKVHARITDSVVMLSVVEQFVIKRKKMRTLYYPRYKKSA